MMIKNKVNYDVGKVIYEPTMKLILFFTSCSIRSSRFPFDVFHKMSIVFCLYYCLNSKCAVHYDRLWVSQRVVRIAYSRANAASFQYSNLFSFYVFRP